MKTISNIFEKGITLSELEAKVKESACSMLAFFEGSSCFDMGGPIIPATAALA